MLMLPALVVPSTAAAAANMASVALALSTALLLVDGELTFYFLECGLMLMNKIAKQDSVLLAPPRKALYDNRINDNGKFRRGTVM